MTASARVTLAAVPLIVEVATAFASGAKICAAEEKIFGGAISERGSIAARTARAVSVS